MLRFLMRLFAPAVPDTRVARRSVQVEQYGGGVCLIVSDDRCAAHVHLSANQALWLSDQLNSAAIRATFVRAGLPAVIEKPS